MDKNQTKISGRGRKNSETKFPGQGFAFFSKFSHKIFFSNLKKKFVDKNQTKISGRGRENSETKFPAQGFAFFSKFSHNFFFQT